MQSLACPRCAGPLVPVNAGNVVVDACHRCHGAFYELGDVTGGIDKTATIKALERATAATKQTRSGMPCPFGHGPLTLYRCTSPGDARHPHTVDVDVCPRCQGVWLDVGEAETLRHVAGEASEVKSGAMWYLLQLFSGLPLEVYHPPVKKPVVVPLLALACVVVFALQITVPSLTEQLVVSADTIGPRPWTLLTHMFVHGGIGHLLGNLLFLWVFGDNVEDRLHRVRFLLLYLLFGVVAAITHMVATIDAPKTMGGASGAIAALLGAYLVLYPKVRLRIVVLFIPVRMPAWVYLGFWIGMNAVGAAATNSQGIAWWAHVGGFVAGMVWGLVRRRSGELPG